MNSRTALVASGLLIVGTIGLVINNGCSSDDNDADTAAVRLARKGEACQTTHDCATGLACLPNSGSTGVGVCVLGVFNVTQTAKECALIECQQASDCCDTPPSTCPQLKESCDLIRSGDGGFNPNPTICTTYESQCICDPAKRDCENGKCVVKCISDSTCVINGAGSNSKCLGGKCAQCAGDDDCPKGGSIDYTCVSGKCQAPCQGDGDCAGFDRCLQGKCIESGCQTNRECIAATRNVEATCGTDGKCIVPCQTDLECGNPKGYSFFSCIQNQCLYMGCESDKDCRLLLGSGSSSSSTSSSSGVTSSSGITSSSGVTSSSSSGSSSGFLTSKQHVVCRDKLVPNATTRPAQ